MRSVAYLLLASTAASLLTGCALDLFSFGQREPWREAAEKACLQRRDVNHTPFLQPASVKGRGVCGMEQPLKAMAFAGGTVTVGPAATLGCPMTEAIDVWLVQAVQPAAVAYFGVPVVEIKNISSYSCRTRNNIRGEELSEHAFGNALDVAAFTFADGREVTVLKGWKGRPEERAFLRAAHGGACDVFKTVLGPGSDRYHNDHFHLDLANHASGNSYCRPRPQRMDLPPRYDGVPMVQAPQGPQWPGAGQQMPGPGVIGMDGRQVPGYGYGQPGNAQPPFLMRRPMPPGSVPMGYAQ